MGSEYKVTHIGYIVSDVEKAVEFYKNFGMQAGPIDMVPNGDKCAFLKYGGMEFELYQPVDPKTPQAKFLKEHGDGINHMSYAVADVEAEKAELAAKGFESLFTLDVPGSPDGETAGFRFTLIDTSKPGSVMMELQQAI